MKLLAIFGIVTLLLLILLLGSNSAIQAQGATNTPTATYTPQPTMTLTPTFLPILPTATSSYGGLYPTPTPLTINLDLTAVARFDTRSAAHSLADSAINSYRAFNAYQIGDLTAFLGLLMFCLILAIRIVKKLTRTHE